MNELYHHGILGMKWGHHKRYDESLESTRTKKDRSLVEDRKKERDETKKTGKRLEKANLEYKYSKQDLKNSIILDRLNSKPKSKSQLAMEEKYKAKGMNADEAAVSAYKNIKTKKILAIAGGVAVTALASYAAYKIHDNRVDKIIKSGDLLQQITSDETQGVRDAFYSAKNGIDKTKYKGMYGSYLKSENGKAFSKQIKILSDIKQASPKHAQETLQDLVKNDPDFAKNLQNYFKGSFLITNSTYLNKIAKSEGSLKNGKVSKDAYEVFNAALVDHSEKMQPLAEKYFNTLASKGYNAIKDVNDSKYSGYHAINPIISFNAKGKVDIVDVKKLTDDEIAKAKNISFSLIGGSTLAKRGAKVTATILAVNGIKKLLKSKSDQKTVDTYRKDHPGTKLSNTEIIRMTERSKIKND